MKQTAVEWLVSILNKEQFAKVVTNEEIQQAKEMEIEQIRRAFCHGEVARDRIDSMEYYNETYGK
jgi:hypothetical protein